MGGAGSGSYYRWGSKRPVAEDYCSLDINWLKREGFLAPGHVSFLRWSCRGQETGSIKLIAHEDSVELDYRYTRGGESEDVHYTVWLTYTPCNYGGERPWFRCPNAHCGRKVGKLYAVGKYFLCRHCYGLAYHSQNLNEADRLLWKAQAIRKRLGASPCTWDPIIWKPKGMHWKTFERLRQEALRAGNRSTVLAISRFGPDAL